MTPLAQLILSFNRSMCDRQRATGPEPRRAESHRLVRREERGLSHSTPSAEMLTGPIPIPVPVGCVQNADARPAMADCGVAQTDGTVSDDDPTMHRAEMPPTGSLSPDFTDGEGCDEYETWVEWCLMHGLEDGDGD